MTLTRIHHVGIVVRDIDRALRFYRDRLALPVTKDAVLDDQGVRGVLLRLDNGELELLEPTRDDTGVAQFLAARGEGLHHLCLETDDIAAELRTAAERGIEVIDQAPRPGLAGMIGFLHPRSNHGVLVEYAQPPAGAPAAPRPGDANGFRITRLDHVAVAVHDLEAATATWGAHFGLGAGRRVQREDMGIANVMLPIGDSGIEIAMPLGDDPRNIIRRRLAEGSEGLLLIALEVDDLRAAAAALGEAGVGSTAATSHDGAPLAFLRPKDAHGVRIELMAPGSRPGAAESGSVA